jgi:hypothetical protein
MQFMYINRARSKEYLTDKGSVNVTTPGLRRYYTELNKQLLNAPLDLCEEFIRIAETWLKIKEYPIVKLALKFNENIKLYLAGYLSRFQVAEISECSVKQIGECLIRLFTILELVDTGYSSSKFKTFLFGLNTRLVDDGIDISEIEREFSKHISSNWSAEEIMKEIFEYEKNVLVSLNEYLFAKSISSTFVFTEKYDIEHIMPASGKNIPQIQTDAGIADREEFISMVNKLGNKILLEEDINRSIGNEWFRTKIQTSVTDKSGYKDSQYAIATTLVDTYSTVIKPYWLKTDIESVTGKIAKRIADFVFTE